MRLTRSSTLIITSSTDGAHVEAVQKELDARSHRTLRVDTDRFGLDWTLTIEQSPQKCIASIHTATEEWSLTPDTIASIWLRKPLLADFEKQLTLSTQAAQFASDEWTATLNGLYQVLSAQGIFWVSDPAHIASASHKPFQLMLARELGWNIPRTVITSDPDRARRFWHEMRGHIIAKPIGRGWIRDTDDHDRFHFIMTNEVPSPRDMEQVRVSPVIFQENIPKDYEVRVTVVGQAVWSAKIESQKSERARVDWRRYDLAHTPHSPTRLPDDVERRCVALVQRCGLQYGAIDLIRTPDGEYVFLEINPVGQYLWIETLTGMPISASIARLLAGQDPAL